MVDDDHRMVERKRTLRLPSWLTGEHLPDADQELRRRYRVQMSIGVSLITVYLMYLSSIFVFFDYWLWGVAFLLVPVFGVLLMVYLYHTGNVELVGHATCLLVLAGIGIPNFMTGGAAGANAASMLILPVTALIVLDRFALIWVGVSILLILGFQVLDLLGFEFPQVIPPESQALDTTITLIISSMVIPGVLWFSEIARRRAEASLVETKEKAESANRAKGQFLANMSHEFRTPLNGIIGLTELMLNRQQDPEQRHQMEMVRNSANTILTLVNDILDFAKVEENKLELIQEKFHVRMTISEILEILRVQAEQKGLSLSWKVSEELPEYIIGDAKRFSQVITNLAANAIKFTEQGSVSVTVEQGQVLGDDLEVLVKVKDTGIGILPERQDAIFAAFTQADGSTTRQFGGSGLGLAISNRLIGLMGGAICVDSEPGRGSEFTFTAWFKIPRSPRDDFSSDDSPPTKTAFERSAQSFKVLLAEDNEINQHMTSKMLEQMGHSVEVVSTGQGVLDRLAERKFDLVFMDVQMPVMDGLDATRAIRDLEQQQGGHTWIVAMTAHAMPGDREMCIDAGMDDYISKPLSKNSLVEILARVGTVAGRGKIPSNDQDDDKTMLLDYEELSSRTRGDSELIAELLNIFRRSSKDILARMEASLKTGDLDELGRAAHSLKGSASIIGAKRVWDAAWQVELASRQKNEGRIKDRVRQVRMTLEEIYPAMDEVLANIQTT